MEKSVYQLQINELPFDMPGTYIPIDKIPVELYARLLSRGLLNRRKIEEGSFVCTVAGEVFYLATYNTYSSLPEPISPRPKKTVNSGLKRGLYALSLLYKNSNTGLWEFILENEKIAYMNLRFPDPA